MRRQNAAVGEQNGGRQSEAAVGAQRFAGVAQEGDGGARETAADRAESAEICGPKMSKHGGLQE